MTASGCRGTCTLGTEVPVYPEGIMYGGVKPGHVKAIIDKHLIAGQPVGRLQMSADA